MRAGKYHPKSVAERLIHLGYPLLLTTDDYGVLVMERNKKKYSHKSHKFLSITTLELLTPHFCICSGLRLLIVGGSDRGSNETSQPCIF